MTCRRDPVLVLIERVVIALALAMVVLIAVGLVGCQKEEAVRPDPPPQIIEMPVEVYVEIDKKYLQRCNWIAEAAIEDIFSVARGRKKCLEIYEANLDTIDKIEGTPKP